MTSSLGAVTFRLYWSGKYEIEGSPEWKISIIRMRTSNDDYLIDALIDTQRVAEKTQQLKYRFTDKTDFYPSGTMSELYCTVRLAKTIEMSAMAFTTYEDKFGRECSKAVHLPIDIVAWPDFKGGEEYRIRIIQHAEGLKAYFMKILIKPTIQGKEESNI